jgi:hypothetical protein
VDSIASSSSSSQIALSAHHTTTTTAPQQEVVQEDRIKQSLAWNEAAGDVSVASHPDLDWVQRVGMNDLFSSITAGGLFRPNIMPRVGGGQQLNVCPPSLLPAAAASGRATVVAANDNLRLQNMLCLQDQQGQMRRLISRLNSPYWRDALFQHDGGGTFHSVSTLQAPILIGPSPGHTFTAHIPAAVPQPLTAPFIDQGRASAQTSTVLRLPCLLSNPFDVRVLSNHQCYLRQQVEVFAATRADTTAHVRGRNKRISLDQVGIQCHHCAHVPVPKRQTGSTYFPATLMGFYQAAQNMLSTHIQCGKCDALPQTVTQEFHRLLEHKKATSNGGRKYWAERMRELGLVDTDHGVFAAGNVPPHTRILPVDCVSVNKSTSGASGLKSKRSGPLKAPPPNRA